MQNIIYCIHNHFRTFFLQIAMLTFYANLKFRFKNHYYCKKIIFCNIYGALDIFYHQKNDCYPKFFNTILLIS